MLPQGGHPCPGTAAPSSLPGRPFDRGGAGTQLGPLNQCPKLAVGNAEESWRLPAVEAAVKRPKQWPACGCRWVFTAPSSRTDSLHQLSSTLALAFFPALPGPLFISFSVRSCYSFSQLVHSSVASHP